MSFKKIKFILPIMFMTILTIMPQVYAKTSIEIKPNASTYTNKTVSEFFDASLEMKEVGEGLEGASVDVHMATNTDWAIFAYFSQSQYGTNGEGENNGKNVTIGEKNYYSTNGNITGMMNLGKTFTYTAGLISKYTEISQESKVYNNGKSLFENANNNTYVDIIKLANSYRGIGVNNWNHIYTGAYVAISNDESCPFTLRQGLFGIFAGTTQQWPTGAANTGRTFRPAIWN